MSVGDMLGTGTISGPEKHEYGSLLELCWGGKEEIELPNGEKRKFLLDGDTIILRGRCVSEAGYTIGFGECTGTIIPALDDARYMSSNLTAAATATVQAVTLPEKRTTRSGSSGASPSKRQRQ